MAKFDRLLSDLGGRGDLLVSCSLVVTHRSDIFSSCLLFSRVWIKLVNLSSAEEGTGKGAEIRAS